MLRFSDMKVFCTRRLSNHDSEAIVLQGLRNLFPMGALFCRFGRDGIQPLHEIALNLNAAFVSDPRHSQATTASAIKATTEVRTSVMR